MKKFILLIFTLLVITVPAIGADRYWVGDTGNSNDTAHWSASSGGAGGETVPGASDNAIWDANSGTADYTVTFNAAFTVTDFTYNGLADKDCDLRLSANITVSGTLTINGNSTVNRAFIYSNTVGTARTITTAVVSVTNADFRDITGAGAGSWDLSGATGGSGDCGGNTDITFTTADDLYWHADSGNFSSHANWFTATNGGGSSPGWPPLPQDTAYFDANSFDNPAQTITQDMPRIGSVDWTGATNTPTFTTSTAAEVYGSITLISAMTLTASSQAYTFMGRGSHTLTSAGKTWAKVVNIDMESGSLALQDALLQTGAYFYVISGTLTTNDFAVTGNRFTITDTVNLGASLVTITGAHGSSSVWYCSGTTVAGTSTIKMTNTSATNKIFTGGGKTYNDVWIAPGAGTGTFQFKNSNTFADFKDDGSAAHSVLFTAATTTTVATWNVSGSAGNLITIGSITSAAHTLACASGIIESDYLDISYSEAGGGAAWYAGANSTDSGNNTGWIFTGAPGGGALLLKGVGN